MEIEKYNLYLKNLENHVIDKVDEYVNDLNNLYTYQDVIKYVNKHFEINKERTLMEYPELNKQVEIVLKENTVEFFAAKNWTQYFGRAWKDITDEIKKK